MTNNLKASGFALAAALTMSIVLASSASAAEFRAASAPVTLTGAQEGQSVFEFSGGEAECEELTYHGTQGVSASTSMELTPIYGECTAFLGSSAEVTTGGCRYRYTITKVTNATTAHGTTDLICPPGTSLKITVQGPLSTHRCTIHIPPQNDIASITYTSEGSPRYIIVDYNVTTLRYTQTAGTGFLPCASTAEKNDGIYTGMATFTGETDDEKHDPVGIWVE